MDKNMLLLNSMMAGKGRPTGTKIFLFLLTLGVSALLLGACSVGEKNRVSDLWVGLDVEGLGYAGQSLPVSATIRSNTPIAHIDMEIQPETGTGWAFTQRYTEGLSGRTSAVFETAVAVPDTAERGDYRLVLRLTEEDGSTVAETAAFSLSIDTTVPIASGLELGVNAAGNDLHLASELTAPAGIAHVVVEITGESWSDRVAFSSDRLAGKLDHHFHEHIHVGEAPKGVYTVVLTVTDARGRQHRTSSNFTK